MLYLCVLKSGGVIQNGEMTTFYVKKRKNLGIPNKTRSEISWEFCTTFQFPNFLFGFQGKVKNPWFFSSLKHTQWIGKLKWDTDSQLILDPKHGFTFYSGTLVPLIFQIIYFCFHKKQSFYQFEAHPCN